MRVSSLLLSLPMLAVGCTSFCRVITVCNICLESKWGYNDGIFDQYTIGPTSQTHEGVTYDSSGQSLPAFDPNLLDSYTDAVDSCLVAAGYPHVDRTSFVVKIASDWTIGCNEPGWGVDQLLPVLAPQAGCAMKGESPDPNCPCKWRAGIRCPNVLVVTPNLKLYKDVLIRWTIGSGGTWLVPSLAACATP